MSMTCSTFSEEIKQELWRLPVKAACCRRALLYGLLLRADHPVGQTAFELTLPVSRDEQDEVQERMTSLLRHQLGATAEVSRQSRGAHRYLTFSFHSRAAAEVLEQLGAAEPDGAISGDMVAEEAVGFGCPACAAHFLRGAFLGAGTVGDPERSAHLEFRLPPDGRAVCLADTCTVCGVQPGVSRRADGCRVFCKRLDGIRDLLSQMGCVQPIFRILNRQMYNEARAEEARATNWDTANIKRSVQAGQRQRRAIQQLERAHRLETLHPELRETARLRLTYPEASLSELAALHDPPITRSGLNHRLARLTELGEE